MKNIKSQDDRSPEPPGNVSEESDEDLESKSNPRNNISSDNESKNISAENSGKEAGLKRRKRVQRLADSGSDDQEQKSGCESANEGSKTKTTSQAGPNDEGSSNSYSAVPKNKSQTSRMNQISSDDSSSDDNGVSKSPALKPRIKRKTLDNISDSDYGNVVAKIQPPKSVIGLKSSEDSSNSDVDDNGVSSSQLQKSRIQKISSDSSDSDVNKRAVSTENSQGSRIKSKREKLHQKFKSLITSRRKSVETEDKDNEENNSLEGSKRISDISDDEATAIEKLKQKIKDRTLHLKSTIYDPDTSDEEGSGIEVHKSLKRPAKKSDKSTKSTPKPARMSAKQAMENMQKIKSESNRMLREKDVSLPYHRPKALSLKDIMSRRRPAVSSDGKALPIKMNEDQLKQYAQMLEERQKEMMELCKSESEEEEINENEKVEELSSANDKSYDILAENPNIEESKDNPQEPIGNVSEMNKGDELSALNDQSFDTMVEQPNINEPTSSVHDSMLNQSEIDKSTEESCSKENIIHSNDQKDNNAVENTVHSETNNEESLEKLPNVECENDQNNEGLDGNVSAEMELVYNDSVNDEDVTVKSSNVITENIATEDKDSNVCTENDSQLISLHFDSENTEPVVEKVINNGAENQPTTMSSEENEDLGRNEVVENSEFQDNDDDVNMEEIDFLIENAELISSQDKYFKEAAANSPMLIKDLQPMKMKPKLTGAPGMVIDLDGSDACAPKKSGVELLKERFTYFAKLKTPEELEREKEKKIKPGMQHLKLKHQLEEMIAEQRSLEWTKRLEEEKQQKMEVEAVIGDADEDCEDDIDKIEAKLEENENVVEEESSESEEELVENDCEMKEKPRKKNPLLDEEAEESDDDTCAVDAQSDDEGNKGDDEGAEAEDDEGEDTEVESSDDDECEEQTKPKKGRILKAFEDSDDEEASYANGNEKCKDTSNEIKKVNNLNDCASQLERESPPSRNTEDEEIQLAQRHKSFTEDLFTSQESVPLDKNIKENKRKENNIEGSVEDKTLASQTFSISKSSNTQWCNTEPSLSQSNEEGNLDEVVEMCTGRFSQNLVTSQTETQKERPSQDIGDDILALCTGKFYNNQFVSQPNSDDVTEKSESEGTENQQNDDNPVENKHENKEHSDETSVKINSEEVIKSNLNENDKALRREDNNLLNSILDELNDPEFEKTKPLKYFVENETQNKENKPAIANNQPKKRLVIDSDDEGNDNEVSAGKKKKKVKKKKLQDRALQFSDDEEELEECEEEEEYESEIEDETERIVEYDSEENEVVHADNPKKKKKASEFFEKEAELTSEDEWVGSGDEDEAGLDRMEREAGDDDHFHQGRLRRELEQIHMRDVLDQDKREVRLIQELLLEDGDLGGGHRQRKFRWKNTGGEDDDTTYAELLDTQEEEFESEEQWRKQRHERETFLRQMKQQEEPEEAIDISVSRTSLIKANLSKTANNSVLDVSDSIADKSTTSSGEKKTAKDIPSPKKPFTLFQGVGSSAPCVLASIGYCTHLDAAKRLQNYHGSLLTRGQGALARLAALALPLAGADDDQPSARAAGSGRNFVFTALSQDDPPKVTKRKADANVETPRLVKKMRTADNKKQKNSLLDHMNT